MLYNARDVFTCLDRFISNILTLNRFRYIVSDPARRPCPICDPERKRPVRGPGLPLQRQQLGEGRHDPQMEPQREDCVPMDPAGPSTGNVPCRDLGNGFQAV